MIRALGSERFSGTYNVPNSKVIVSPLGVVSDAGSMMISPAFRSLGSALALCVNCAGFPGSEGWVITCGETRINTGMRNIAARGFIPYPLRPVSLLRTKVHQEYRVFQAPTSLRSSPGYD